MFEDIDWSDPRRQAALMAVAGLLSPQDKRLGKGGQFAAALSQGMQGGLLGYNQARQSKRRDEVMGQQAEMQKMQMDEMRRGQQFNQALSQGYQAPVNPLTPNDDEGNRMPSSPEGFDFSQAMRIDPVKAMQMKRSMTPQPNIQFAPNGRAVNTNDPSIVGQDFAPAPKPEKPKYVKGDVRTIKAGNFEETQEYDGESWKRIGQAPLWKPDAPEKPAKPIWDPVRGGFITPAGFQPVPGVSPTREPEQEKVSNAQSRVSEHLDTIRGHYKSLGQRGGVVDPSQPALTNIRARLGASVGGQMLGGAVGTEEQTLRDKIQSMRPLLIQEIRSATGMSAKAMDSNAELQFYLRAATDPTQSLPANLAAIDALEKAYGLGAQGRSSATSGGPTPPVAGATPKIEGLTVTGPDGSRVTFPNQAALAAWKKQVGL